MELERHPAGGAGRALFTWRGVDAKANADFIAHAREDIPWLLAERDTLAGALAAALAREQEMREALRDGLTVFADSEWARTYQHLWGNQ